jgi:ATP-binding cassette subfamily B protein
MQTKKQSYITYPKVTLGDVLKAFWRGIRERKGLGAVLYMMVIAGALFDVFIPLLYKHFFDVITAIGINKVAAVQTLVGVIVLILLLKLGNWIAFRGITFIDNRFLSSTMGLLRTQAFENLMDHSYTFFANNFTGSLVQKVNRFSRALEQFNEKMIWQIMPLIIKTSGTIIILFFINKLVGIILLVWVSIFIGFNYVFALWKLKYDIERAAADTAATGTLSDALTNHNTIQLFAGVPRESERFIVAVAKQMRLTRFIWDLEAVVEAIQAFLIIFVEFTLFYFAIKYWSLGMVTVGTFVLIQIYIIGLVGQLWNISHVIRDLYSAYADAKEMVEIMKLPHEIKDAPRALTLEVSRGEVGFNNVSFNFNETRKVLDDVSITIKGGEKVALIGPSGAGKSTFVRLILRLYEVTSGEITIDGQNIAKVTQESLRRNISLVPQDPILFHRTLMENIRYGRSGASDEEVIEAARQAHCDEFIDQLPLGYQTFVGERGIKLSGGERQRVAIARAILKRAPILILDEATSSLDSHSEALIQDALGTLMKDCTTIVIAHRLSTIRMMDKTIVLDAGKVLEEGSHNDLLARDESLYKKLWTLQAGGFLKTDDVVSADESEN